MSLEQTVSLAQQRKTDCPLLIAIDGHSAAGKSTFASKLAQALTGAQSSAPIIHTDDFYRPINEDERFALDAASGYQRYYDWQRLKRDVLQPLSSGQPARFQRYDWPTNRLDTWRTVEPIDYVIIEGCYAARPELKRYYAIIVLMDISIAERDRRQRERADATPAWLDRWHAAEAFYLTTHRPRDYADFVVPGT